MKETLVPNKPSENPVVKRIQELIAAADAAGIDTRNKLDIILAKLTNKNLAPMLKFTGPDNKNNTDHEQTIRKDPFHPGRLKY